MMPDAVQPPSSIKSEPEPFAYILRCYKNGVDQGKRALGLAKEITVDVRINWKVGNPQDVPGVGFDNEVPPSDDSDPDDPAYPIIVTRGKAVGIIRAGAQFGFFIPWRPVVRKCPGATPGAGGGKMKRDPISGALVKDTGGGGGLGAPGSGGGAAGSSGGGVGVPP